MSVAAAKQRNRDAMPQTAAIVDAFRARFGNDVRVLWAREGDMEVGVRQPIGRYMTPDQWLHFLATGQTP
jgi:hypothetical protein